MRLPGDPTSGATCHSPIRARTWISGERTRIMPGEYHVHRLAPKVRSRYALETLRFVGADPAGGDIHVPLPPGSSLQDLHAVEVIA